MLFFEVVLLAVGLSMDSLAVSVTGGALVRHCSAGNILKVAAVMGAFQAGFTILGYLAGLGFQRYITAFDHWIAFALLAYLGGKMIYGSFRQTSEAHQVNILCTRTLCGLAVATSIDALAIGVTLALLKEPLTRLALTIGLVTFLFSAAGMFVGSRFGERVHLKLDLLGGLILIAIGTKILIEHLFFS